MQTSSSLQNNEISIKDLFKKLKTLWFELLFRWKIITACAIAAASVGLLISFLVKPIYRAETTFVLENSGQNKLSGYGSIAAQFGLNFGDAGGMFQDADNIIALLQSRAMITRTLLGPGEQNPLLAQDYIDFTRLKEKWQTRTELRQLDFRRNDSRLRDSVLGLIYNRILKENLIVGKPDKKLDIISIATTFENEIFAKRFTDELLKNVTDFYIETQTKKTQENVFILRHQVDSVRTILNAAITGVAVSAEANPNLNPALQRLKVPSQKRMIDVEMNKTILEELIKNLEIAEISLRRETPLIQVIDRPILPLEKKKLGKLKGTFFGGCIGLLLASAFVIGRFYWRKLLE